MQQENNNAGQKILAAQTAPDNPVLPDILENENSLALPGGWARSKEWIFDGVRIIHTITTLKRISTILWENDIEVVHLHFNIKGTTHIRHEGIDTLFKYRPFEHNIAYCSGFKGSVEHHGLNNEVLIIQFTKSAFLKITDGANEALEFFAEEIFKGKPVVISSQSLIIDMQIYAALENIINCRFEGKLRRMYLWSKCMELLVLQSNSLEKSKSLQSVSRQEDLDRDRLTFARDYILKHADNPPTIIELSRIAGINEFKLKKQFKELFGNTIFGLLSDYRLELAQKELIENKKKVSQIASELGYSSLSHFSSAFKKKFGISPKQIKP